MKEDSGMEKRCQCRKVHQDLLQSTRKNKRDMFFHATSTLKCRNYLNVQIHWLLGCYKDTVRIFSQLEQLKTTDIDVSMKQTLLDKCFH